MDLEAWKLKHKLLMSTVFNFFSKRNSYSSWILWPYFFFKVSFSGNPANSALESLKLGQFKNSECSLSKVSNLQLDFFQQCFQWIFPAFNFCLSVHLPFRSMTRQRNANVLCFYLWCQGRITDTWHISDAHDLCSRLLFL